MYSFPEILYLCQYTFLFHIRRKTALITDKTLASSGRGLPVTKTLLSVFCSSQSYC
jgi:hypothetical protein